MSLAILGIGTAVPRTEISMDDAIQAATNVCARSDHHARLLNAYFRHTEIETRHLVLTGDIMRDIMEGTRETESVFLPSGSDDDYGPSTQQRMEHYKTHAPGLALQASRAALAEASLSPEEITHLITVTCTGFYSPGLDRDLIAGMGLPGTVERTQVGFMGCHGAFNGLRVARAFADSNPNAKILMCAVELCSAHYSYGWHPEQMLSNALFSDGAAALVVASDKAAPADAWHQSASGSYLFPNSADAMTWTIGNHGFSMTLSSKVPDLLFAHLKPWLSSWLDELGLTIDDIKSWATHPGGPRILTFVQACLELPNGVHETSRKVLTENGNMSSPTVLFILQQLRAANAPRPCVALGFGPGLTAEAMLFT